MFRRPFGSHSFFSEVRRQRFSLFWAHQLLVTRLEYRVEELELHTSNYDIESVTDQYNDSEGENDTHVDFESEVDEIDNTDDRTPTKIRRMPYLRFLLILIS